MKTAKRSLPFIIIFSLIFSFCTTDSVDPNNVNSDATSINEYFNSIPDWEINEIEPKEDIYIDSVVVTGENPEDSYECPVFERNMVTTISNFISVGTNFGTIWPGAIIQGNSLKTGELKLINANEKRAPITLVTNIALDEVSKTITPNSETAQQAIADFMIAAGEMPEGTQSGAGTMNFHVEEATTFEQSMQSMGISAGFTEPQSSVGLDASLSVESSRNSSTHTVVAKYVQEMFTVRVADDLIPTPADFFTSDFSMTDIETMENAGLIGENNIPIYIESVTYGRILLFSMQSESVASSNKLSAALEASMADYANAGGELDEEHDEIFSTATHKIFSAGGTDGAANAAIANLDWSRFFVESPASTAVPISFVAKTLSGKEIVGLVNSTTFERRDNCSLIEFIAPPAPEVESYDITVEWTETDNTGLCIGSSRFGTCAPQAYVKLERDNVFSTLTVANGYKRAFTIYSDDDYFRFTIRSVITIPTPPLAYFTTKTQSGSFDVKKLQEGTRTYSHSLSNFVGSVKLTYQITKTTNYGD